MKTAMQEMLLNIESIESKTIDQEQLYMLTALKICAITLLEKEKEQIIEAGNICAMKHHIYRDKLDLMSKEEILSLDTNAIETTHGEDYYNETYQNK